MKKLLFVMLIALVAMAFVACGGETVTTDSSATTTAPDTTKAEVTTTEATLEEDDPTGGEEGEDEEGIDILYGDPENYAIKMYWKNTETGAFENHHYQLGFNWAYVLYFQECEGGIYEDLIWTPEEGGGTSVYDLNLDYKWVLTIDGEPIEITNFSIYNRTTWGYVRMDLGADWEHSTENLNADGYHEYDIRLDIYDVSTGERVYYAWFTDPDVMGPHVYVPTAAATEVVDPNRDPSHVLLENASAITGPAGMNEAELYTNLFDYGELGPITKLCSRDYGVPIVWTYDEIVTPYSYSLIGAGDDATYDSRVPTNFKFYGSMTGNDDDWTLLDVQAGEPLTEATNYAERNFVIDEDKVDMFMYFKLEIEASATYQLSGIKVYTK